MTSEGQSTETLNSTTSSTLDQLLAPMGDYLQQAVADQKIAGAVALIERLDSKDRYFKAFGYMDIEANKAMKKDAIFRIASMSKPITAVAAMMLVEEGVIHLDDPIANYLPEWSSPSVLVSIDPNDPTSYTTTPATQPITIRNLLTNTSGITYRFFGGPLAPVYQNAGLTDGFQHTSLDLQQQSSALAALPLARQPGSGFNYGLSMDILGRLIEVASGTPLDRFFHDRIFCPLGMEDTYFYLPTEAVHRMPALYTRNATGGLTRVQETGMNYTAGFATYAPDYSYTGERTYFSGGAGLASTAHDYMRFLHMIIHGGKAHGVRLLQQATVDQMIQSEIGNFRVDFVDASYGFGFGIQDTAAYEPALGAVGTYFWGGTFKTWFWVDRTNNNAGVVMTQLWDPANTTIEEANAIAHGVLH